MSEGFVPVKGLTDRNIYTGPRASRESIQLSLTRLFLVSAVNCDTKGEKIVSSEAFWAKPPVKTDRKNINPVTSRLLLILLLFYN
jgi:hypothetical protein